MGLPEVVEPSLEAPPEEDGVEEGEGESAVRRTLGRLRGIFRRSDDQQDPQVDQSPASELVSPPPAVMAEAAPGSGGEQDTLEGQADQEQETDQHSRGRRFFNRIKHFRHMILAKDEKERGKALKQMDRFQRADFKGLFKAAEKKAYFYVILGGLKHSR